MTTDVTPDDLATSTSAHPLLGVRVVEFGHIAAGPFATMLLADLGADVVKVEGPTGDQMRSWPPIAVGPDGDRFSHNFASLNRNKRSLRANLKDPDDNSRVRALCMAADVVVENFRPGVLSKLGLGFDDLAVDHRGLVYCSISGFGQTGANAQLGAYDVVIQAMSGLMSVTGTATGELVKSGVPVADFVAGLYGAMSTIAWVPVARASGTSHHLDVPMLDCMLATSALQTSEYWGTGTDPTPRGTKHSRNAPYQAYSASDGPFVLAAGNDGLWRDVCDAIGDPGLADDPRFRTQPERVLNQDILEVLLNQVFAQNTAAHWIDRLRQRGVPAGPVNTFAQALADPTVVDGGLVRPMTIPVAGETRTTVFPVRVDGLDARLDLSPPRLGEHTDEILAEWEVSR